MKKRKHCLPLVILLVLSLCLTSCGYRAEVPVRAVREDRKQERTLRNMEVLEPRQEEPSRGLSALAAMGLWEEEDEEEEMSASVNWEAFETSSSGETWAVYWYLCGSDLESGYGSATTDLEEMMEVELPDEVKIIIQTGGAKHWQNDFVDESKTQRWVYEGDTLYLVDEQPKANMGETETLTEFLSFCKENYPADNTMVLFWNHGGGSASGVAFDENYRYDSLSLNEMYLAFEDVYSLSVEAPPIDIVGFDACLMATIDTAYTFYDVARFMIASQNTEPGCGWEYAGWVGALAEDPGMSCEALGRVICDTYEEGCGSRGREITLSVVDLTQAGYLLNAYDKLGEEALISAVVDPTFFASFGREASRSENYGGNTDDEGYSNMVDLGHLIRNSWNLLPEYSSAVLEGLDRCVVYQVRGEYCQEATGLSCYYSYNGDLKDLQRYEDICYSAAFMYLYDYCVRGNLSEAGQEFVSQLLEEEEVEAQEVPTVEEVESEDLPVTITDNGVAVLDVGPEMAQMLSGAYFVLCYVDYDLDLMMMLGRDNDLIADWENGVFTDNFRGVWAMMDGNPLFLDLVYEGADYNIYSVPILLNDEEYSLRLAYDFNRGRYEILGARKGLDETGMADKNLRLLEAGDEITPMFYACTITGDDELKHYPSETFTIGRNPQVEECWMGDGEYVMMFELTDAASNSIWSDLVSFTIEGDEIYTSLF